MPICKKHALFQRSTQSSIHICQECISAAKQRETLIESPNVPRVLFTLLTHTGIVDSDSKQLIGYLDQQHERLFRFETGQWYQTADFQGTLSDYPLVAKGKSVNFMTPDSRKILTCPGISDQDLKLITNVY